MTKTNAERDDSVSEVIPTADKDRRKNMDRRNFSYTFHIPERRNGSDRRNGLDRRRAKR